MPPPPPSDADLLDLALGRLPSSRRETVQRAVRADPDLQARYTALRDHLARYDALETPEPPAFADLAPRLAPRSPAPRVGWLPQVAAVAAVAVLLGVPILVGWLTNTRSRPAEPVARVGPGLDVAPGTRLARDARVEAETIGEVRIGESVRVVLDEGARLRYVDPHRVALETGRAHVRVEPPYDFRVDTPRGPVTVTGTAFEVDLRDGDLHVAVEEGAVLAAGRPVHAGEAWQAGRVAPLERSVGAWFRLPRLRIEAPPRGRLSEGLVLDLVLEAPGALAVPVAGPADARRSLWLEVRDPTGAVHDLDPGLEGPPFGLEAGGTTRLEGGERRVERVRIAAPSGLAGSYRCRAMYRPQEEAPAIAPGVRIELAE